MVVMVVMVVMGERGCGAAKPRMKIDDAELRAQLSRNLLAGAGPQAVSRFFSSSTAKTRLGHPMDKLPIEIVHHLVFRHACSAQDVLSLALTSRDMYWKILGKLGEENRLDALKHKATAGLQHCVRKKWWKAAMKALEGGLFRDVNEKVTEEEVREMVGPDGECEVVARDGESHTPLVLACVAGELALVEALLGHPEMDPSIDDNDAIAQVAWKSQCLPAMTLLLQDERVDPCAEDNRALRLACEKGNVDMIEHLLRDPRVYDSVDLDEIAPFIAAGHMGPFPGWKMDYDARRVINRWRAVRDMKAAMQLRAGRK